VSSNSCHNEHENLLSLLAVTASYNHYDIIFLSQHKLIKKDLLGSKNLEMVFGVMVDRINEKLKKPRAYFLFKLLCI